ncbi:probable splicing factor, arginine/serine-rich 6 [Hermetia illucens]|nr:probable splicing factor, arginine/serine-rich 6 [Hermetia illucens]
MTNVVHITGLVNEFEMEDLEGICRLYGAVEQIRLGRGVPKEAFVEFKDPQSAANLAGALNGQEMCGDTIKTELYVNYNNECDSFRSRKYRKRETLSTRRDTSESRTKDCGRQRSFRMYDTNGGSRDANKHSNPFRGRRREVDNRGSSSNCRRVPASKDQIALKRDRSESRARVVNQRISYGGRYHSKRDGGFRRNDRSKTSRYHAGRSRNDLNQDKERNHLDEDKERNTDKYGRFTNRDRSESPRRKYRSVVVQPAKRRRVDSVGSSYSTTSSQHSSVISRGVTPDSGNWD